MAKKYSLVAGLVTYISRGYTFKGGVVYQEATLGDSVHDLDDYGNPYFVEVTESDVDTSGVDSEGKRTIVLGAGKQGQKASKPGKATAAKGSVDGTIDTASAALQGEQQPDPEAEVGDDQDQPVGDSDESERSVVV